MKLFCTILSWNIAFMRITQIFSHVVVKKMMKIYSKLKFDTCLISGILQYKTIFFVVNNVINDAEINVSFFRQFFAVFYLAFLWKYHCCYNYVTQSKLFFNNTSIKYFELPFNICFRLKLYPSLMKQIQQYIIRNRYRFSWCPSKSNTKSVDVGSKKIAFFFIELRVGLLLYTYQIVVT